MTASAWKARLAALLRWGIGLGLLILALKGLDWRQVRGALATLDWRWSAASLASILFSLALKALRWQWLLRGTAPRSQWFNLFGALLAGQAVNIVLPVRGGELSRALLVTPRSASRVGIVTAIGAEKIFDLVALTVLAVGWLPGVFWSRGSAWAGGLVSVLGALGLWGAVLWGERLWQMPLVRRWLEPPAEDGERSAWRALVVRGGHEMLVSLRPLRTPGIFFAAVGLTVVIWANMLATNILLFEAFRLKVSVLAGLTVLVLVHLGLLPSLMPGNIGPFYFFTEIALQPFGVPAPVALSYAVVLHALVALPPLLGGGLFLLASRRQAVAASPT